MYDGIQFIPVNYSAFSLDFLSFRELARIVPALPPLLPYPLPSLLGYAYDFIHVKCYVNRGLFSQRIYNYSAAAYFAAVYLALPVFSYFY